MNDCFEYLPARTLRYIRENDLIAPGDHVLAAVSGGPDSVALLSVLIELESVLGVERITVLHFDHRLRGEESDADREFVSELARAAGLDFRCGTADVASVAREGKISVEMAARECRHSFFRETVESLHAHKIAVGHTADDQAEEIILRLLRGTGPAGMRGMAPATAEGIIRPLLFVTRDGVLDYLRGRGIEFRNDSTNFEAFCQRNFLRLKIFPLLRQAFNPRISETIARYAELAREEESWWAQATETSWGDVCIDLSKGRATLDLEGIKKLHPALVRRILRRAVEKVRGNLSGIGVAHLGPLIDLVFSGKTGKSVRLPGGVEAFRQRKTLLIKPMTRPSPQDCRPEALPVPGPGNYFFGQHGFELSISETACSNPVSGTDRIFMDMNKLKWPLEFRFRKPGDRFHPFGMTGSKKLQDFFTDCMVPREEREKVPLLCDREKICWVAGMRMDDRVKIDECTRAVLMVRRFGCFEAEDSND